MSEKYLKEGLDKLEKSLDELRDDVKNIDKNLVEQKLSFDHHIIQDEKMYQEFKRMNDILSQNTDSLKEHMMRTELLETAVLKMDKRISPIEHERLSKEAVKEWWKKVLLFTGKASAAVVGLAGVLTLLAQYF